MMKKFNPNKQHRRSIRLKGYDYSQLGAYFVTVCAHQKDNLFGRVINGSVELNEYGQIVTREWFKSSKVRHEIELDAFVLMPNHLHGIVWIVNPEASVDLMDEETVEANGHSPLPRGAAPKSLGAFIIGFKSTVTRQINQLRTKPGHPVWQRNYYEHIIRSERALHAIREYIEQNPLRWEMDRYNPVATKRDPKAVDLWNLLKASANENPRP